MCVGIYIEAVNTLLLLYILCLILYYSINYLSNKIPTIYFICTTRTSETPRILYKRKNTVPLKLFCFYFLHSSHQKFVISKIYQRTASAGEVDYCKEITKVKKVLWWISISTLHWDFVEPFIPQLTLVDTYLKLCLILLSVKNILGNICVQYTERVRRISPYEFEWNVVNQAFSKE